MFTHANIRTPQSLGYFISRPEMHAIHHERGAHSGNYCGLPVSASASVSLERAEDCEGYDEHGEG